MRKRVITEHDLLPAPSGSPPEPPTAPLPGVVFPPYDSPGPAFAPAPAPRRQAGLRAALAAGGAFLALGGLAGGFLIGQNSRQSDAAVAAQLKAQADRAAVVQQSALADQARELRADYRQKLETQVLRASRRGEQRGRGEGRREGFAQGQSQGYAHGQSAGFSQGQNQGYNQGRREGFLEGTCYTTDLGYAC